jgi:hypothetical protein
MKKISIRLTDNDQSIMIPLKGIGNLLGYDDDVTKAVEDETDTSINDVTDAETRRILPSASAIIQFQFWNGTIYTSNKVAPLEFTGFTDYNTVAAKNSFYVIQLFDSFRDEVQSKKHTGYYNGFDFAKSNLVASYTFNADNEFSNLYVAQSVLDSMSGTSRDFYIKFLFYSAKSGKFYSFFNQNAPAVTTQEKLYHKININPNTLQYSFVPVYTPIVLRELLNPVYDSFVNATVQSIPVEKPNYPSGNTFDNSGSYITI